MSEEITKAIGLNKFTCPKNTDFNLEGHEDGPVSKMFMFRIIKCKSNCATENEIKIFMDNFLITVFYKLSSFDSLN